MAVICVTGGAGFIGSHLVTALVERGDSVRVLDNLSTGNVANLAHLRDRVELVSGDILDPSTAARAVVGTNVVFHLAALPSVPLSLERPLDVHAACATGTLVMLDAARRAGVERFVYAGSSSAYGERHAGAQVESQLPQPLSPYAAAKLAGEAYCESYFRSFGLATVVLRFFNVYGERQDPSGPYSAVIPLFLAKLQRGEPLTIFGDGRQTRDFCYVGDVVAALLLAASVPGAAGHTCNVASGTPVSLLELVDVLGQVVGVVPQVAHAPPRAGDIRDSSANLELARAVLGFEPRTTLAEGLRRSADYYRRAANE